MPVRVSPNQYAVEKILGVTDVVGSQVVSGANIGVGQQDSVQDYMREMSQLQQANIEAQRQNAQIAMDFERSSAREAMDFEAQQAQINRDFQTSANKTAMDFEAQQAQINRDFQMQMSNTAYQRAVDDLKKAGLNPILAYNQGGAHTTTGATASGFSSAGSTASGYVARGVKADTDTNTSVKQQQMLLNLFQSLFSTMVSSAAKVYGDTMKSIGDILPG